MSTAQRVSRNVFQQDRRSPSDAMYAVGTAQTRMSQECSQSSLLLERIECIRVAEMFLIQELHSDEIRESELSRRTGEGNGCHPAATNDTEYLELSKVDSSCRWSGTRVVLTPSRGGDVGSQGRIDFHECTFQEANRVPVFFLPQSSFQKTETREFEQLTGQIDQCF